MKATVFFKDYNNGKSKSKTIEVEKNEPNHIIREFIKVTRASRFTFVTHIKCGRYDYQWHGECVGAGIYK